MFAHFAQETGGHDPHAGVEQWRQGLVYLREAGCTEEGPGCGYDSSCSLSTWQVDLLFSRPGQSQGLLYEHINNSLIHRSFRLNIFMGPSRPNV